ncbi:MAG: zinc dependent phospholipase C family protein [Lachnospiraceae bacterium]|nr:zinc dependent phospholipase C family protein [Lachnospiraceae bacterium]
MRKKSHISLAKHIVNISDIQNFNKHKKAFYVGSILPDCKPSFLTKRHEISGTFDLVEYGIEKLTKGYKNMEDLSTLYFTRLGEVMHYIADYFTFPHNKEYPGNIKEHCIYEGELKHKLRQYIRNLNERDMKKWKASIQLEDLSCFQSVADICNFLKEEHRNYIRQGSHSAEEDCKYIVGICSKAALAILHVCKLSIGYKNGYVSMSIH